MHKSGIQYDFIIGIPRSGTTLLGLTLNQSKEIFLLLEFKLTLLLCSDLKNGNELKRTRTFLNSLNLSEKGSPYDISKEEIANFIAKNYSDAESALKAILPKVSIKGFGQKEVKYIVEKNPGYSFKINHIKKNFPNSKMIWATRDPRGFVNSRIEKKNPENRIYNPYFLAYLWNEFHKKLMLNNVQNGDKMLVVKYEELVVDPETKINEVLSFLDINEDVKELMSVSSTETMVKGMTLETKRKKVKFEDLKNPINQKRVFAWRDRFSVKKAENILMLTAPYAQEMGYDLSEVKNKSFLRLVWLRAYTFHWFVGAKLYAKLSSVIK